MGRLAVAALGEPPLVVPVNHGVEGRSVLVRSSAGRKVRMLRMAPVSFQADASERRRQR